MLSVYNQLGAISVNNQLWVQHDSCNSELPTIDSPTKMGHHAMSYLHYCLAWYWELHSTVM